MKNKSLFIRIIAVIIIAMICLTLTVIMALIAGALDTELFDFKNLNYSNLIPVLLIGGFISCFTVGLCILFVARTAILKAAEHSR